MFSFCFRLKMYWHLHVLCFAFSFVGSVNFVENERTSVNRRGANAFFVFLLATVYVFVTAAARKCVTSAQMYCVYGLCRGASHKYFEI